MTSVIGVTVLTVISVVSHISHIISVFFLGTTALPNFCVKTLLNSLLFSIQTHHHALLNVGYLSLHARFQWSPTSRVFSYWTACGMKPHEPPVCSRTRCWADRCTVTICEIQAQVLRLVRHLRLLGRHQILPNRFAICATQSGCCQGCKPKTESEWNHLPAPVAAITDVQFFLKKRLLTIWCKFPQ